MRDLSATMPPDDSEILAQEVSAISEKVAGLERRMAEVERVNSQLEQAAVITARSMKEISGHWDAVCEAMRRAEKADLGGVLDLEDAADLKDAADLEDERT
jgi:hypothetical protein